MCGIMGYVGPKQAAPILLAGLERLEYRGYDSAGLAVVNRGKLNVVKSKGRLHLLAQVTDGGRIVPGNAGIGHTRWATHGEPSDENSHPHQSKSGRFAVVHNGIIENYRELKASLERRGYTFASETDSEVVAHLVEHYAGDDLVETMIRVMNRLEGSYALGVIDTERPDRIVAVRKSSPLIVGIGSGENYVASDIPAILPYTRDVYLIDDHEIAEIAPGSIRLFDCEHNEIRKDVFHVEWDMSAAEKGGHEHFMIKEILEEPAVLADTARHHIRAGRLDFSEVNIDEAYVEGLARIHIVACGSAYHVAVMAKTQIERFARIPVDIDMASDFAYRDPLVDETTLVLLISQSGETADTLNAMRTAKAKGARMLGLVNVVGSTMAREIGDILYTKAGPEIAVATTKAYVCQAFVLTMLAVHLGRLRGLVADDAYAALVDAFEQLPERFQQVVDNRARYQELASRIFHHENIYFIGRSLDYATALEGSLKLKEVTYISSEAFQAGELKHGPIALIERDRLVFAIATQSALIEKMKSNIAEVRTREGTVVTVTSESLKDVVGSESSELIVLPDADECLMGLLGIAPLQLIVYYVAVLRGLDVDKPRNLAKSVTVE